MDSGSGLGGLSGKSKLNQVSVAIVFLSGKDKGIPTYLVVRGRALLSNVSVVGGREDSHSMQKRIIRERRRY